MKVKACCKSQDKTQVFCAYEAFYEIIQSIKIPLCTLCYENIYFMAKFIHHEDMVIKRNLYLPTKY